MYCQARRKRANLLPKPCEHFGDNIPHASLYPMQGEPKMFIEVGGPPLQLDDHLKNLLRELGHAINDTVSESDRITGAIAGVRAHGYDIVLKLDATIGLAKRDAAAAADAPSKLTTQDKRFLESLRIQVDQESFDQDADKRTVARLTMTPQDVRFLKSLRIATDDLE
jgi:hypothetical protein